MNIGQAANASGVSQRKRRRTRQHNVSFYSRCQRAHARRLDAQASQCCALTRFFVIRYLGRAQI